MARSKLSRIGETFRNQSLIDQALKRAARKAIHQHKQAGLPLVVWRDGKAVWVSAAQLGGNRKLRKRTAG